MRRVRPAVAAAGALAALFALGVGGAALANHTFSTELHRVTLSIGTQTSVFTVTDRDPIAHNTTTTVTNTVTETVTQPPTTTTTTTEPPPPTGFPNASNTGPTGPLTESTGDVFVTTAGTVIENRKINGCVIVSASNVTIRNSEIRCDDQAVVVADANGTGAQNLVVEDSLIECAHHAGTTGITWRNYTVRRSELFGCENILWVQENVVIEDSYIHDPIPCCGPGDPHTDSIQIPHGGSNIRIQHNTVYGGYIDQSNFGNSAITAASSTSNPTGVTNVQVLNNLLAGGGATLRCPFPPGGFTWNNNRFSRIYVSTVGGFSPTADCEDDPHVGNVYHETGEPIP